MRNVKTKQLIKPTTTRKPLLLPHRTSGSRKHSTRLPSNGTSASGNRSNLGVSAKPMLAPPSAVGDTGIPKVIPAAVEASLAQLLGRNGIDLNERVKELLRLAKEQGYLTFDD